MRIVLMLLLMLTWPTFAADRYENFKTNVERVLRAHDRQSVVGELEAIKKAQVLGSAVQSSPLFELVTEMMDSEEWWKREAIYFFLVGNHHSSHVLDAKVRKAWTTDDDVLVRCQVLRVLTRKSVVWKMAKQDVYNAMASGEPEIRRTAIEVIKSRKTTGMQLPSAVQELIPHTYQLKPDERRELLRFLFTICGAQPKIFGHTIAIMSPSEDIDFALMEMEKIQPRSEDGREQLLSEIDAKKGLAPVAFLRGAKKALKAAKLFDRNCVLEVADDF